ncbi:MAG: hypothetical protein LBQ81_12150 [Zoogloeaceae bacterium]|jgi:hypothetical protein|nr:hypothetical protein [Zoogloeaceae bacterium]
MKITVSDLATVQFAGKQGFCAKGCRAWAKQNGFDWMEFVREGIDADRLAATGNPMALALIAQVMEQQGGLPPNMERGGLPPLMKAGASSRTP